jgi:SAM-dependent methyltransferase
MPPPSNGLARLARLLGERAGVPGPSSWLIESADLLPAAGPVGRTAGSAPPRALDVACGSGRHALLLAAAGFEVHAIDRDAAAIEALRAAAGKLGLALRAEDGDLEAGDADPAAFLGPAGAYDLILVIHYLHRPLFPALVRALAPGGLLLYETFTVDQAACGHPRNPAFLLEHGELPRLVAPLEIVRQRDGEFDGRWVAAVAARSNPAGAESGRPCLPPVRSRS